MPVPEGCIDVWLIALADISGDEQTAARVLSAPEQARAARFAFPHLTQRFIRGRIALRHILGRYAGIAPEAVTFGIGERGKPHLLAADGRRTALTFNMSDAGGHVLIGVTTGREIGVDIEAVRPIAEMDDLVGRNFSAAEQAVYWGLPPAHRQLGFFTGWTRKEAYTKAVGLGLYLPLESFSVTLDPDAPARFVEIDGSAEKAAEWSLLPVTVPAGHVGAIVAKGPVEMVRDCTWAELLEESKPSPRPSEAQSRGP